MKVNWPFDRAKRPRWLDLHQHRCENSTTTNCCPETSARNCQSMLRKIPEERRSHLHGVRSLKSRHCRSVTFTAISMPTECTDWGWQGVFFVVLFTCMRVSPDIRERNLMTSCSNDIQHWQDCHLPYTVYKFRLCSIFISVFKNVNMIKWFKEEEELEKQRN
jgi:hypothetical protein